MSKRMLGWSLIAAGVGTVLSVVGAQIAALPSWEAAKETAFVGKVVAEVGSVLLGAAGGKLLPQLGAGARK